MAAILIEPVQGEGGYYPAPVAFMRALRALCDEHGILLIADEVQSGYGRTGEMWAFEHAGIVPDVVCVAKAIANGLPLSAIVTRRELGERWGRGAHGSTYGGNPVACAAGVAVLETIRDERLVENARARGAELSGGLRELMADHPAIGNVRGPGLMIGVEFVKDRATGEPDGVAAEAVASRADRRRAAPADLRHPPPGHPLDPADRRHRAGGRGGAPDLRGRPGGLTAAIGRSGGSPAAIARA